SAFLQDMVFDKSGLESSIWMSATLATPGEDPFGYFKRQVGIEEHVIQSQVPSPFDYRRQALLYLPRTLPEPNQQEFVLRAADEIEKILSLTYGRAFVLFTSKSALNTVHDMLQDKLEFPVKKQGEMPRQKLIEWFKSTPNAVLFGTSSFWEGVSV